MDWFYEVPEEPWSAWSILCWWEARRPVYNGVMLAATLLSLGLLCFFISQAGDAEARQQPFESVGLLMGFLAMNICYTAGPVVEIVVTGKLSERCRETAPAFMRAGLKFSLGTVFLPTVLWALAWVLTCAGI